MQVRHFDEKRIVQYQEESDQLKRDSLGAHIALKAEELERKRSRNATDTENPHKT